MWPLAMRRAAALFLAACCSHAVAFLAPSAIINGHSLRRGALRTSLRMAEDDDDIAALEAKLASLKRVKAEEAAAEAAVASAAEMAANAEAMEEVSDGFDFATLSSRKKVATIKTAAPSELLSEAWKEDDSDSDGEGLPIVQIVGAGILAVALIAFSQIPVGSSNVDPVTYGGRDARLETPAEIKARYEKVMNEE